jgi:hypothetical protein
MYLDTDIKICPANQAVHSTDVNSCAEFVIPVDSGSDYCGRTVSTRPTPSVLERHGSILVYHVAKPRQLFFKCQSSDTWENFTMTLEGAGVPRNAGSCYVTA